MEVRFIKKIYKYSALVQTYCSFFYNTLDSLVSEKYAICIPKNPKLPIANFSRENSSSILFYQVCSDVKFTRKMLFLLGMKLGMKNQR